MSELLTDAIFLRGVERILTIFASIFFGYLGYRLFLFGATTGKGKLDIKSEFFKLVFSGSGPGLFFMHLADWY